MKEFFRKFAHAISNLIGSPGAFALAVLLIVGWAISGPAFDFSDTWQLVINTTTTIVTFLIVFLIQNTQNRDAKAIHIKLDELIRATSEARDEVMDIQEMPDNELERLREEFHNLGQHYHERREHVTTELRRRKHD
jgi:low affinity Fe/Cu permease